MRKSGDGAWSPGGHRIKAELAEKTWVCWGSATRRWPGRHDVASSGSRAFYQQFLQQIEDANPGEIWVVTDNLSSRSSMSTRAWLEGRSRIHHAFVPVGACWLNLQEGWWRIFREAALAGRSFANRDDITYATALASNQLNSRAHPWIWGRPTPPTRPLRRRYVYSVWGIQH
ncbi:transposase [Streptomyces sp. NBC_01446]|uniref:transposase n=1 Tax=Streptomyces sp. NBC_01446 TaxID=2903870 RepID=UPI002B1CB9AC|nr:transposase [Streptomyces sp. NBC_01446]